MEGCSCWGLMCMVLEAEFGKTINRFEDVEAEIAQETRQKLPEEIPEEFEQIGLAQVSEGDVLLLNSLRDGRLVPLHVGVIVGKGKVLHISEGTDSIIEDYTKARFHWRVAGAYRAK